MNIELAEYVVMPNHFHGILTIGDNQYNTAQYNTERKVEPAHLTFAQRDAKHSFSSKNKFGPQSKNLGSIIRGFKSSVTTYARTNDVEFNWQARFHEHIITTEKEYFRIAEYIVNNPNSWLKDKFFK